MAIGSNKSEAQKAASKSRNFAKKVMQFAHQWEVDDLRAAGLNPILSATGGSPALASAAAPTGPTAAAEGIGEVEGAVGSARSLARVKAETQIAISQAKIAKSGEEQAFNAAGKAGSDWSIANDQAIQERNNTEASHLAMPGIRAQGALDKSKPGSALRILNRAIRSVTGRDTTGARPQ